MTKLLIQLDDSIIDGCTFTRNSVHFNGLWEVHLSHRIGSALDQFGRPIGKYTSGRGQNASLETALTIATVDLIDKVIEQLSRQNSLPPSAPGKLSTEADDLLSLLDLEPPK